MKILLVGDANSIFLYNYVKYLKQTIDVNVDVYCPFSQNADYSEHPYDNVCYDGITALHSKISKRVIFVLLPFIQRFKFEKYLRRQKCKYDIIHFHWILPSWVIGSSMYKTHSRHICATAWGGEMENLSILGSKLLYRNRLQKFMSNIGFYIGSPARRVNFKHDFPSFVGQYYDGIYGSSIIEAFSEVDKAESFRDTYRINPNKITILTGYSGKALHRHEEILTAIVAHKDFAKIANHIHFIFSMTRGSSDIRINNINNILQPTGVSYTIIKDGYQSDLAIAQLRLSTDIAFQLSEFDGLSSSVKEILCAGSILISGNWFPLYTALKEDGFKYFEVSDIQEGVNLFYDIIQKFSYYQTIFKHNQHVGLKKYLWTECIKQWSNAYNDMLS